MSLLSMAAVVVVLHATAAYCQPLDVSQCFNGLLQQKIDYASSERTALSQLAVINEDTFEASKHNGDLSAAYKFLQVSASYADFAEKRRQYFQLNKLDFDHYRNIALASRTLDSAAYPLIAQCIDRVAATQYGFHYIATVDRDGGASVRFFWRSTSDEPLKIIDSYVGNATVKNPPPSTSAGKLYPSVWWWTWTPYPRLRSASPSFYLERQNPEKNIEISLTTNPQVEAVPIIIEPPPHPTVEYVCQTVYDSADPATG